MRDAVVDLTPSLRNRLPAKARLDRRAWLLAPLALAGGAATHVLWDSTTHDWGFVVHDVAVLREEYGPLPLYSWLQLVSTLVGSVVVAAYGVQRLRRGPVAPRPAAVRRPELWLLAIPLAAVIAGTVLHDLWAAVGAALLALLAVAVGWRVVRQPRT